MTHRDELNAMSNAEFGAWLDRLMHRRPAEDGTCDCPADEFCGELTKKARLSGVAPEIMPCAEIIADWLRAEA